MSELTTPAPTATAPGPLRTAATAVLPILVNQGASS
jgi:hypothetical protein